MHSDQEIQFEEEFDPGESKSIRIHPKRLFKGIRLVVHDSNFAVTNLSVGPDGPAKFIGGSWVEMDVCDPSAWIQIEAKNRSSEKRFFKARLEGVGESF